MEYQVCLEEIESRWIAHIPAVYGCFSSGETRASALEGLAAAVEAYYSWRRAHGDPGPFQPGPLASSVDEIHRAWLSAPDYEVNAFFAADQPVLAVEDVPLLLQLLEWCRADLLAAIHGLSEDDLTRQVAGERWPLRGVVQHVGIAEWWYLDRLHLAIPRASVPEEPLARLEVTRDQLRAVIPRLAGLARTEEREGELWSPGKVVRRALWHERDHTHHIRKIRARLGHSIAV